MEEYKEECWNVISGATDVGLETNVADIVSDPEILLKRHKRVMSGYGSEVVHDLSPDNVSAEIERVKLETDHIKRRLAALSRKNVQSSCESDTFADDSNVCSRSKYVTTRAVQHPAERQLPLSLYTRSTVHLHPGRQPSIRSPATSPDRHHRVRQPTLGRQPSSSSSTTPLVRQHMERLRSLRSSAVSPPPSAFTLSLIHI